MISDFTNFSMQKGVLVPDKGELGGKNQGVLKSLPHLSRFGYMAPSSLLLPTEALGEAIGSFSEDELVNMDDYDKYGRIHGILSSTFGNVLDKIVELFPDRVGLRASDLSDDTLESRLPGLYLSLLFGKQPNLDYRLDVLRAVSEICADYVKSDKAAYRIRKGMPHALGLLVQDLAGMVQGNPLVNQLLGVQKFFPDLAGYVNTAFPDKVIIGMCKGFGSITVDSKEHYVFEYHRSSGKLIRLQNHQYEIRFLNNGRMVTTNMVEQPEISDEFVKQFVEKLLVFQQALGFPEGYGLDFEFAIPSMLDGTVYVLQNSPLRIVGGNIIIPEAKSPIVTPESYLGVGEKVFTHFAIVPEYEMVKTGRQHADGVEFRRAVCHYDPALTRYNQEHRDYLLFILPMHILAGNIYNPNGTFRFTNTYNAGGVAEVAGIGHSSGESASHFKNFMRCIQQLFIAGSSTPNYSLLEGGLQFQRTERRLIVGTGEIYMAVDENAKAGILDLRRIDKVEFYGG